MSSVPTTNEPPQPGDVYEGFTVTRMLGTGTFAWVLEARHPDYAGPVAMKISRHPVETEETALRALREIRILGSLSNPHVVHIFDHGLGPDERWYMVMELLEGGELSAGHDFDRPMPPAQAARVVQQACLGLDEAHRAGIVHRDIKPDNLWKTPDGTIKVLDFGLARAWDTDNTIGANATTGHMLVGTPHYAQPEQIHSGKLTPASDVYSLGFLLYELLVGRTPLFADQRVSEVRDRLIDEPLKWLIAHVKEAVVPLTHYPEGRRMPRRLVEVVDAALAKDPTERPATAGALANRLAWVLHHDLGCALGGVLEVRYANGAKQRHLVLPGVHRMGIGPDCEIALGRGSTPRVDAILEWAGAPYEAELRPLAEDDAVRVNGHIMNRRVRLVPGTFMEIRGVRLELQYPRSMKTPKR